MIEAGLVAFAFLAGFIASLPVTFLVVRISRSSDEPDSSVDSWRVVEENYSEKITSQVNSLTSNRITLIQ